MSYNYTLLFCEQSVSVKFSRVARGRLLEVHAWTTSQIYCTIRHSYNPHLWLAALITVGASLIKQPQSVCLKNTPPSVGIHKFGICIVRSCGHLLARTIDARFVRLCSYVHTYIPTYTHTVVSRIPPKTANELVKSSAQVQ